MCGEQVREAVGSARRCANTRRQQDRRHFRSITPRCVILPASLRDITRRVTETVRRRLSPGSGRGRGEAAAGHGVPPESGALHAAPSHTAGRRARLQPTTSCVLSCTLSLSPHSTLAPPLLLHSQAISGAHHDAPESRAFPHPARRGSCRSRPWSRRRRRSRTF